MGLLYPSTPLIVNGELIIDQKLNRQFKVLKTLTTSRTSAGRYHVSILIEDTEPYPKPVGFNEKTTVGIDVGIKSFTVLSTGQVIGNLKFLKSH